MKAQMMEMKDKVTEIYSNFLSTLKFGNKKGIRLFYSEKADKPLSGSQNKWVSD